MADAFGKLNKEQKEAKLLEEEQKWEEERKRRKRALRSESNMSFVKKETLGPLTRTHSSSSVTNQVEREAQLIQQETKQQKQSLVQSELIERNENENEEPINEEKENPISTKQQNLTKKTD